MVPDWLGKSVRFSGYDSLLHRKLGFKKITIDSAKYKPGAHSFTLTTYFADGTTVVKRGNFKRCAVRSSQRRVSPNFTG